MRFLDRRKDKNIWIQSQASSYTTLSHQEKIIDESVKNCCVFVYWDEANYDYKDGKFVEVTWDELMEESEPVEVIVYE